MFRNFFSVRFSLIVVMMLITFIVLSKANAYEITWVDLVPTLEDSDFINQPELDISGNIIADDTGHFNYLVTASDRFQRVHLDTSNHIQSTEDLANNPFSILVLPEASSLGLQNPSQGDPDYLKQIWKNGIWGTGLGASGINSFDIDNDGILEIVLGGGYGFGSNRFWHVLSYNDNVSTYQQEWLSQEYNETINRILVSDAVQTGLYNIYVALSNGNIEIYDGMTRQLMDTVSTPFPSLSDITIADVDNDNTEEIITTSPDGISVFNAATLNLEWQTTNYTSHDVEVGNVDMDAALEIVTTNHVIDGISHAVEWDYPASFGYIVQLADIDNDNMAEIIAAEPWYQINAFDADTQAPKWDFPADIDIDALIVTDYDNDNVFEIVYGDGQWGAVYVIDSTTLVEEWHINNPEHGVTGIGFGDVDGDSTLELLWGAGWSSSGSDHLFVGDTSTHNIEWQSEDIGGPLTAVAIGDVDNDGTEEIVMVSSESDSGYDDGMIFVYDAETYALEWQSDPILNGHAWTGIQAVELANLDNDAALEILVATADLYDGLIVAYDGITHNLDWQTAEEYNGTYFSALAVADIDNDGSVEVIGGQDREHTGADGVYVRIFDGNTGIQEWQTIDLTYWGGVYDIDTGDFDNDGNPEILFSVTDGNAYVYDGVTHVQEWQSSLVNTRAVAGTDVDQNGEMELLVAQANGQLYAFNAETYTEEWNETISAQAINSLKIADMDRDSVYELLLSDENFVYVLDAPTRTVLWQSQDLGNQVGKGGHLRISDMNNDTRDEVVIGSNYALYAFTYAFLPFGATLGVDQPLTTPESSLTYTIDMVSFTDDILTAVITDMIPVNTSYITNTLQSSAGAAIITGDLIQWNVVISPGNSVSLTFGVTVDPQAEDGFEIVNTAVYTAGSFLDSRSVSSIVDAAPPTSDINQPVNFELISGTIYTVTGTAIDTVSTVDLVELSINGDVWQTVTGTTEWHFVWTLPMTDDLITLETRAIDAVGFTEQTSNIITVTIDNLSPFITDISPAHGETNVVPTTPIVIEFSEPVLIETFDFLCQPAIANWDIAISADNKTITLNHPPFELAEIYSCIINNVEDIANHNLVASEVNNPWAFTTSPIADTGNYSIFLPMVTTNN